MQDKEMAGSWQAFWLAVGLAVVLAMTYYSDLLSLQPPRIVTMNSVVAGNK